MRKLLAIVAATGFALSVSSAFACDIHGGQHVTASKAQESVAMSTYDGAIAPRIAETQTAAAQCTSNHAACTPASH